MYLAKMHPSTLENVNQLTKVRVINYKLWRHFQAPSSLLNGRNMLMVTTITFSSSGSSFFLTDQSGSCTGISWRLQKKPYRKPDIRPFWEFRMDFRRPSWMIRVIFSEIFFICLLHRQYFENANLNNLFFLNAKKTVLFSWKYFTVLIRVGWINWQFYGKSSVVKKSRGFHSCSHLSCIVTKSVLNRFQDYGSLPLSRKSLNVDQCSQGT